MTMALHLLAFLGANFIANNSPHFMGPRRPQIEAFARSRIYLDYQRAFTGGTGLPLALHGAEMLRLVRYRADQENLFCSLMGKTHKACAACYALQQELAREAGMEAKTLRCFAGLCESAVPVRFGENLIAFLHTGQVLLQQPTQRPTRSPSQRAINSIAARSN